MKTKEFCEQNIPYWRALSINDKEQTIEAFQAYALHAAEKASRQLKLAASEELIDEEAFFVNVTLDAVINKIKQQTGGTE